MSRMRYLVKQKQEKMKRNKDYKHYSKGKITTGELWICDFETLTVNTEAFKNKQDTQIILWVCRRVRIPEELKESGAYINYKIKKCSNGKIQRQKEVYDTNEFVCGTDGVSFIDFILNSPKNATFYFHNLKYDATYIIPLLSKDPRIQQVHFTGDKEGIKCEGYEEDGRLKLNYWDMFRDGKKIFNIKIRKYGSKNPVSVEFRCTALMLSSSVKALGKSLVENGETFMNKPLSKFLEAEGAVSEDFYNVEPFEELEDLRTYHLDYFEYCLRDVEIVRRHMLYFEEMINTLPTVKSAVKEKQDHNEKQTGSTKHNKYKNNGNYDIWGGSISIAGLMRKLLKEVYIPTYQANNKAYAANTTYIHNKEWIYGNLAHLNHFTYKFFTEIHNLYPGGVESGNAKIFRGGFTQLNPKLQEVVDAFDIGDCGKWDISSAYPYQMTKPLPFGRLIDENDFIDHYQHLKENEYYEYLIIPVDKAEPREIAKYCATLPNLTEFRDADKNRFRYSNLVQEKFTLAVLRQEWEELQHWYKFTVSEVYQTQRYYMLATPFLKDIAIEMYNEKDRYNREGKAAQKQGVKIAINSVYGSMGIRSEFDSLIYMNNENAAELEQIRPSGISFDRGGSKCTSCNIKHISKHLNTNYTAIHIKEIKEINQCWNVAAAATITALERIYLMETIRKIGPEFFGYCDTDSIIFTNLTPEARRTMEETEKIKPLDPINLGQWEVEYRYIKGFIPHKAKEYIQIIYKYDEKNKTFLDDLGNPCDKANAVTFKKNTGAGFTLNDPEGYEGISDLFYMSKSERKALTEQQIEDIYKDKTNITKDFIERIKNSNTLIVKGNKVVESFPSGDVIIWEDKWTKWGTI